MSSSISQIEINNIAAALHEQDGKVYEFLTAMTFSSHPVLAYETEDGEQRIITLESGRKLIREQQRSKS